MKAPTAADIAYQQAHVDDNAIPGIIAANVICIIGAWIAAALRLYSRRLVRAPLKADDWLIVASLVRKIGSEEGMLLMSFSSPLLYMLSLIV